MSSTLAKCEQKAKESEKYRRLFLEQKEKLATFKRNRKKLQGSESEIKNLYNMLSCQVTCVANLTVVFLWPLNLWIVGTVGLFDRLQGSDAALPPHVLPQLHSKASEVTKSQVPSLQHSI